MAFVNDLSPTGWAAFLWSGALVLTFLALAVVRPRLLSALARELWMISGNIAFYGALTIGGILVAGGLHDAGAAVLALGIAFTGVAFHQPWADTFDVEIDRISNPDRPLITGDATKAEFRWIGLIGLVFTLAGAYALSGKAVGFVAVAVVLNILYDAPPLRMKDSILSPIGMMAATAAAFGVGFLSQAAVATPALWRSIVLIAGGIVIATPVKDLKDYQAEVGAGCRNLVCRIGLERTKRWFSTANLLMFTAVPALFGAYWGVPLGFILGLIVFREMRAYEPGEGPALLYRYRVMGAVLALLTFSLDYLKR
jgi:4-hydroxybenzoate polyprenyltransferase